MKLLWPKSSLSSQFINSFASGHQMAQSSSENCCYPSGYNRYGEGLSAELIDMHVKIENFLDKAENEQLVCATRELLGYLQKIGKVKKKWLLPQLLGVHFLNRDGYGVNPADVHLLITDLYEMGFHPDEAKAVCCTVAPADRTKAQNFQAELVKGSAGLLAECDTAELQYFTLQGSHTNEGLKCIEAGVDHENPDITDENGKLSRDKMAKKRPMYAEAAQKGLEFLVIDHDVMTPHMPRFAHLIQAAGNAPAQVTRSEHQLQVLRKIYNAWHEEVLVAMKKQGKQDMSDASDIKVSYDNIKRK
eukprot:9552005-Karenia_brevis.AAC.1